MQEVERKQLKNPTIIVLFFGIQEQECENKYLVRAKSNQGHKRWCEKTLQIS